jgi:hypothetical protein
MGQQTESIVADDGSNTEGPIALPACSSDASFGSDLRLCKEE